MSRPLWLSINRRDKNTKKYTLESDYKKEQHLMRNPFLHDYGSILHLAQFRRLVHKTQVYSHAEDNVRNRMIHSFEVAHVAKQLVRNFVLKCKNKGINISEDTSIEIEDCLDSICIAHDLGHPPFAHTGERALFKTFSAINEVFDSNVQNIRILTNLNPIGTSYELNITAGVLDGLQKRKPNSLSIENNNNLFSQEEREHIYAISKGTGTMLEKDDSLSVIDLAKNKLKINLEAYEKNNSVNILVRHPLTYFMDAADDISNMTADIEDALKMEYIDIYQLLKLINKYKIEGRDRDYNLIDDEFDKSWDKGWKNKFRECDEKNNYGPIKSSLIRSFIKHIDLVLNNLVDKYINNENDFYTKLPYKMATHSIESIPTSKEELGNLLYMNDTNETPISQNVLPYPSDSYPEKIRKFKKELYKCICSTLRVQEADVKGEEIVRELFNSIVPNSNLKIDDFKKECEKRLGYINSKEFKDAIEDQLKSIDCDTHKVRKIFVDYIASMSDRFAEDTYKNIKRNIAITAWKKASNQ